MNNLISCALPLQKLGAVRLFSIIGSLNAAWSFSRFGNASGHADCLKPSKIHANSLADGATPPLTHSRHQLILANAPSTSSDFSAFTKWPYCPSVAIFLAQNITYRTRILRLHFGDCIQRNFVLLAVKCHGILPLSTAVCLIYRERWPAQ